MKIKLLIGILVSIALYSFSQPFVQNYKMPFERPKNVIILIGNGMGLSDITGGLYTNGKSLNLESCEIVGFIKQNSSNNLIPDAASSTTAIVTGEKVKNGWLGLDSKGHPIQNIFEMAKEKKMSTGIITNGSIFGQAPAAFVAHTKSSDDKPAILNAYLSAEVDFLVGAGMNDFNEFIKLGDHIKTWESLNYLKEDFSMIELGKTSIDVQKNYLYFLEEFDNAEGYNRKETLVSSKLAPGFLKAHGNGNFILFIESHAFEKAGLTEDANMKIDEMIAFDKVIGEALRFAKEDRETLVLITSTRETGGFKLNSKSKPDSLEISFVTAKPNASLMPIFAFGPGSESFSGIYDNTKIFTKLKALLGL